MNTTRKISVTVIVMAALLLLAGCAGTPPTKFDTTVFEIKTNYVPSVVNQTNTVWKTNEVYTTVTVTNSDHVLVQQYATNYIPVPQLVIQTITNIIPVYDYQQGSNAAKIKETAAAVGNIVAPGVGGPIAGAITGLLLTGYGWFRSSKRSATIAGNLAQVVEASREVLKTVPNGNVYDAKMVEWMQNHQAEAGVLQDVIALLGKSVNNADAQVVAKQINDAVSALTKPKA